MRRLPLPAWVLDCALTAAMVAFVQLELRQPWDDGDRYGSIAMNTPLVALVVLPLALRTVAPVAGLVLMLLALGLPSLFVAHTLLFWGGYVPLLLMVFSVARRDGGLVGRGAWLVAPFVFALQVAGDRSLFTLNEVAFDVLTVLAVWGVGRGVRRLDLSEQELSIALRELDDQRTAREARAVVGERTRIAGEMHDVVAHAVSLMVLQVGAARLEVETVGGSPRAAGQLHAAEGAGRDALDQLRRSLSALRQGAP